MWPVAACSEQDNQLGPPCQRCLQEDLVWRCKFSLYVYLRCFKKSDIHVVFACVLASIKHCHSSNYFYSICFENGSRHVSATLTFFSFGWAVWTLMTFSSIRDDTSILTHVADWLELVPIASNSSGKQWRWSLQTVVTLILENWLTILFF